MEALGYPLITEPGLWSIIPPLIAIVLALITKEVVFSLICGILSGTVIYSIVMKLGFVQVLNLTTSLFFQKLSDNSSMIIFLSLLGIIVVLVSRSGGTKAYGEWVVRVLTTKNFAGVATSLLGIIIFIDDYFNCLTVGTVMRPVTDRLKMSREKLAYIIDATAAPICIIAPISSWAAAVISYFPKEAGNGMSAFIKSIPMNFYAMLTIFMVFYMSIRKNADYGPMAFAEKMCEEKGFVNSANEGNSEKELEKVAGSKKGKVSDLIFPIVTLIVLSVLTMLYVGGLWTKGSDGYGNIAAAFGNTDAGPALTLSAFITLIVIFIFYLLRGTMNFSEYFDCITSGVQSMVSSNIILVLAWSISAVCRELLNTGQFVADTVQSSGMPVQILPAMIFIIACVLAFATGTAWGTFGILIPIVIPMCLSAAPQLLIASMSATLAGSVFGDHSSPISDTTILASAGAECFHLAHVATQAPYAVTVAVCCIVGYIIAGFTSGIGFAASCGISLVSGFVLLNILLIILPKVWTADKVKSVPVKVNTLK